MSAIPESSNSWDSSHLNAEISFYTLVRNFCLWCFHILEIVEGLILLDYIQTDFSFPSLFTFLYFCLLRWKHYIANPLLFRTNCNVMYSFLIILADKLERNVNKGCHQESIYIRDFSLHVCPQFRLSAQIRIAFYTVESWLSSSKVNWDWDNFSIERRDKLGTVIFLLSITFQGTLRS